MTDTDPTLDADTPVADTEPVGEGDCPEPGCGWTRPEGDRRPPPLALGSHRRTAHGVKGKGPAHGQSQARRRDRPPTSIKVDLGGGRKPAKDDPVLAAVEQRAKQLAGVVAVFLLVSGSPDDSRDIEAGKDVWAASVRNLAVHEKWLRALGQGGEGSARGLAWAEFVMATGALTLPILLRHGAVPPAIANLLSLADLDGPSTAPGSAGDPVAA